MPIYTYKCKKCGVETERVISYDKRDYALNCQFCDGVLSRLGQLERPTIGKPGYQMQAVLSNGAHVKGHFGKEAKRKRR